MTGYVNNTYKNQSMTMIRVISSMGKPTAFNTITIVTRPACGTPAAPMLANVAVILKKKPNNIETISKFRVNYYKHAFTISLSYFEQSSNGRIQRALSTSIRRSVEKRKNILTSNRRRNFDCTRWGQSTMLSLLYYAKILKSVKSTLLM